MAPHTPDPLSLACQGDASWSHGRCQARLGDAASRVALSHLRGSLALCLPFHFSSFYGSVPFWELRGSKARPRVRGPGFELWLLQGLLS